MTIRVDSPLRDRGAEVLPEEGIVTLPGPLPLHFGGALQDVRVAWSLSRARVANAPVVVALGGISAGRRVFSNEAAGEAGWWQGVVGPHCPVDADRFAILGIDFLGGSGETTGPAAGGPLFPSVSAFDQATVLQRVLAALGIERLHAIVGASYGGMVALAFAARHPQQVGHVVAISAADRAHPMATAWRCVQRAIVRQAVARGEGAEGLRLARALAMATYRSPAEFAARFAGPPVLTPDGFRFPVESYLFARGDAYARRYVPEAFVCLSESIDLHVVDAAEISVPTTLIGVLEDQLVPIDDLRSLRARIAGPATLVELSSVYGHDAFLKEVDALRRPLAEALGSPG